MKVIGTGSYGKVILSKKRDNQQVYAIKTLKKMHLIKKNQVEHTIAERSILVGHNNDVKDFRKTLLTLLSLS
jgi:serum/glucocorticoid-regulated kinase 2